MLIVSMGAGLGNQMFEYAFFTRLRILYPNEDVKLDTRYAFPVAHNGIELFDIFGIKAAVATRQEVIKLTNGYGLDGKELFPNSAFMRGVQKLVNKLYSVPSTMRIQADYTEYYKKFFEIEEGQSIYFLGPFANYHYFSEIKDEIRELYKFPAIVDGKNLNYAKKIKESNSVSIHIRRGDYVDEGIELTPLSFYEKAIAKINQEILDAQYFIFTDDAEYAKQLFPDNIRFTVVEGNTGKNSFRDMQLMSLCKHNITANSTFSFWGAFLNRNPNKIVIAPDLAYTGTKFPFVCDDWILI